MTSCLKNEKGLTLVELLVAISTASIMIVMIISIHLFIQKQYDQQAAYTDQTNQITTVLKMITTDFRKAKDREIEVLAETSLKLGEKYYVWDQNEKIIQKNDSIILDHISLFSVIENEDVLEITIGFTDDFGRQLILTRREGKPEIEDFQT